MVRTALVLLVGGIVGFATRWLAFDSPLGGRASVSSGEEIELELLKRAGGDYSKATCTARRYPTNVWDCTAEAPPVGEFGRLFGQDFTVTVGEGTRLRVVRRGGQYVLP